MLTEHRKKQISTFTGVIFAAGVAVAGHCLPSSRTSS